MDIVNCPDCGRRMPLMSITEMNPRGLCDACLANSVVVTDVSGKSGAPGKTAHPRDARGW